MTPHDKNTLDRLWDDVPVGAPPIDDLVRSGKTMRRRARLRVAGGAAALTLAVVAGSAVAANTVFDSTNPRPDGELPAAVDAPTASAGKRLVGVGRVVVAVPAEWGTNELDGCGSPEEPTVWFPIENTPLDCITFPYGVASVQFTTLDTDEGRQAAKYAATSTEVDGVEVRRGVFECPPTARCVTLDREPEYVVVPSENVVITLFGPARDQDLLDAIADSIQILPEAYTTVPFVEGNNLAAWKTAIAEAGLVPEGALPECEDVVTPQPGVSTNALCEADPRIRLEPGPGSVVAVGSTVTLFPSGPLGTPVDLPTSEWEPGDDSHQALGGGTISIDEQGCVTLTPRGTGTEGGNENGPPTYAVWPKGYTATIVDGQVNILDPGSDVVARQGDVISAGGGYGPASAFPHPCLPEGTREVFIIQSPVTVVQ